MHAFDRSVGGTEPTLFEGLVVLEASYGPIDPDPEARDLVVDVTVAIQALVHKSQLYIPGHRSKVCGARFRASSLDFYF